MSYRANTTQINEEARVVFRDVTIRINPSGVAEFYRAMEKEVLHYSEASSRRAGVMSGTWREVRDKKTGR